MNRLFTSDDQNNGASASVLPMGIQGSFPLRLIGLISLLSKKLSGVFSSTTLETSIPRPLWYNSHPYMTAGKIIAWTRLTVVGKVLSLLFNTLSRFVIAFLPRSKHLNFMAAVTLCSDFGAQENKACHCLHFFPTYLP